MGEVWADLLPRFYFRWNGISMKPILMSEVMPKLTSRHERSALKTHVLLLNSPGQQKAKQSGRREKARFRRRDVVTP